MQLAAALEQLDHGSAVVAHRTGNGDLVALGRLVKLDGHILHVKAAVGQLEAGAQQLCQIGVHLHRGQQQLLGLGVGVVVLKAALRLLNAVHTAPHGCLPQGQVVDVLNAVKGHGVEQYQAFQLVLVFLLLCGIVKQVCHKAHTGPQHRNKPDEHQHRDQQTQGLPPAAALDPGMFFRGDRVFHWSESPKVFSLPNSIPHPAAECKTCTGGFFVKAGFLFPVLPYLGLVAHGGLAAVAHDGGLEQLLVFKQLVLLLPVHQRIQQRKGLLVLCCRIYQRFPAAQGARHVIKLAPAHALFLQVDQLELNAALLEIALRLFGIKALARAKDLDIHLISSCRFPAVLLYHTVNRLHRHNLRQNGQCFPQRRCLHERIRRP